jgi:nucleoside-diphosphate-sugar epimerase
VRGTTSILNSALKHGSTLKRFVLTSSVAAVREETTTPRVFDETNWNNAAVEAVKAKGSAAGPILIYLASKTLAERAAWDFVAAHKSEISWDLVAINPPYIFGVIRILFRGFFRQLNALHVFQAVPQSRADC